MLPKISEFEEAKASAELELGTFGNKLYVRNTFYDFHPLISKMPQCLKALNVPLVRSIPWNNEHLLV